MELYFANLGDGQFRDSGNGSGMEWGSFLLVRVFFYGPGLNFDSSEMININMPMNKRNDDSLNNKCKNMKVHNFIIIGPDTDPARSMLGISGLQVEIDTSELVRVGENFVKIFCNRGKK